MKQTMTTTCTTTKTSRMQVPPTITRDSLSSSNLTLTMRRAVKTLRLPAKMRKTSFMMMHTME